MLRNGDKRTNISRADESDCCSGLESQTAHSLYLLMNKRPQAAHES